MTTKRKKPPKQDFAQKRRKLGKGKLKPINATDTAIRSKSVLLRTQNLHDEQSTQGELVTNRNLSLADLIPQLKHYNPKITRDAVKGIKELITLHPIILRTELNKIIREILPLIMDADGDVRKAVLALLEQLFEQTPATLMGPFIPLVMAFISTGLTHMLPDMRRTSMSVLESLLKYFPVDSAQFAVKILPNLVNVFTMSRQGHAYKGTRYKAIQDQVVRITDTFLSILFHYNKLKIPRNGLHTHTHRYEKTSHIGSTIEFKLGEIVDQHQVFASLHAPTFNTLDMTTKLLQRKQAAALSQSTSLLSGDQSDARTTEDIFGHKTSEMVLGSDIRWNLEDEESILKFFKEEYKNLIEVWIEHLGDSAVERSIQSTKELATIHNTLSVLYRILYSYEQIASNVQDIIVVLQKGLPYLLKQVPLVMSSRTKTDNLESANSLLVGVLSFVIGQQGTEGVVHLMAQLLSTDTNLTATDFGILLGAFHRSLPQLPEAVQKKMWVILMQTILFEEEKRKLVMEFFAKDCKLVVGEAVEIWAKELGHMLNENTSMAKSILDVLLMLSKQPKFEQALEHNIKSSIIPFFYSTKVGPFVELDRFDQGKALQLISHLSHVDESLIRALSKCCSDKRVQVEMVTQAIETLRYHKSKIELDLHVSFLLTLLCAHKHAILTDVLVSLRFIRCSMDSITPFLTAVFAKSNIDLVVNVLLRVVCVVMEWSRGKELLLLLPTVICQHLRFGMVKNEECAYQVVDDLMNAGLIQDVLKRLEQEQDRKFVSDAIMHLVQSSRIEGSSILPQKDRILKLVERLRKEGQEEWKLHLIEQRLM